MSAPYLGDFPADQAVYFTWSTNDSDGASITRATDGAVSVYKDNSDGSSFNQTQVTTGVTNDEDMDSLTGVHSCCITTTDAWYETGHDYEVVLSASTIDGQTVNATLAHFSIENRSSSLNATALAALEDQFDGTGITGDSYPSTQAQVGNIASGTAAINTTARDNPNGFVITTGSSEANNEDSTHALDGTTHDLEDTGGATDCYYIFDVGADGVAVSVNWHGYVQSNNDTYTVHAYNWAGTAWQQIGSLDAANGSTVIAETFDLTTAHTGTGANVGLVRFRFLSADGTKVATDRVLCSYAQASTGIANGSTVTLAATTSNTNLVGNNWTLALGGQDISGSYFRGAEVTGIASGSSEVTFEDCHFGACTIPPGTYIRCGFGDSDGLVTAASDGEYVFKDCYSIVAGSGTPDFTFAGLGSATGINNRGWFGGYAVTLDTNCTLSHEVVGGGGTTITPADANVEIRGLCRAITIALADTDVGNTIQVIANTGPVVITSAGSGDSATINLYGTNASLADASNGTTNDFMVSNTSINAEADTALTDYDPPTKAEMDTGHGLLATEAKQDLIKAVTDALTAAAAAKLATSAGTIVTGTQSNDNSAATSTVFHADDITEATANHYIGRIVIWTSGDLQYQATDITDYSLASGEGEFTVTALTEAPGDNDTFIIV